MNHRCQKQCDNKSFKTPLYFCISHTAIRIEACECLLQFRNLEVREQLSAMCNSSTPMECMCFVRKTSSVAYCTHRGVWVCSCHTIKFDCNVWYWRDTKSNSWSCRAAAWSQRSDGWGKHLLNLQTIPSGLILMHAGCHAGSYHRKRNSPGAMHL